VLELVGFGLISWLTEPFTAAATVLVLVVAGRSTTAEAVLTYSHIDGDVQENARFLECFANHLDSVHGYARLDKVERRQMTAAVADDFAGAEVRTDVEMKRTELLVLCRRHFDCAFWESRRVPLSVLGVDLFIQSFFFTPKSSVFTPCLLLRS